MKTNSTLIMGILFLFISIDIFSGDQSMKHLWIKDKNLIEIISSEKIQINEVSLYDSSNNKLSYKVLHNSRELTRIETQKDLTLSPWYRAEYKGNKTYSTPHYEYLNHYFYYTDELGVSSKANKFFVNMWSPTANKVELLIYKNYSKNVFKTFEMTKAERGRFYVSIPKEHEGLTYQYKVYSSGQTTLALDPYAKVMESFNPESADSSGRAILYDLGSAKPRKSIQNMASKTDFIGYEAHVRDFSISKSGGGTYLDFLSALPHISDLGVTHIQFMPLQNFYTVIEEDRSWQGSSISKDRINYNWGYDPQNFFTPEGHFSKNSKDHLKRIDEVKELFKSIHKKKIGVILDVVYNHLYAEDTLENAAPGAYMRRVETGEVSFKSGAGASLESRNLMTRRIIIDSLKWWKNYFGVDGFRFDLMGFLDIETMKEIRKELGVDTILYGEAWEFTDLPKHQATTKSQIPNDLDISAFNDTSRDSYAGAMQSKGFIQGESHELPKVRSGLVAGYQKFPTQGGLISQDSYHLFAKSPVQALNFLTIHDGFTLWDKINLSYKGTPEARKKLMRQAMAMLFTSQGRIVFHGGMEIGRSKPLAKNDPNPGRAHTTPEVDSENGVTHFHENSYRSPDLTNFVDWNRKSEFKTEFNYLKSLIDLRRKIPALRYASGDNLVKGLTFLGGKLNWPPGDSSGYQSFNESNLDKLTIKFINAPQDALEKEWFLAGEIHPEGVGGESKNPIKNNWKVFIDKKGKGSLSIKKGDLLNLDLDSWSDPEGLQFKLVSPAGSWNTLPNAYSTMGNNTIKPLSIPKSNTVTIDLSVLNHESGREGMKTQAFVAYRLDNTLETDVIDEALDYKELIVVHNGENNSSILKQKDLDPAVWKIILDGKQINFDGLSSSEHVLSLGELIVAPQSSAILIKR